MPVIFYTKEEHFAVLASANKNAMCLAQALCEALDYPCIRGPQDTPDGPGEYCDGCPAKKHCPHPYKEWSK